MPSRVVKQINNSLQDFFSDHLAQRRVHSKSLVSTLFGDVVVPNDGRTWVETICAAFAPLGVNERLVRTTLFRLREENWLEATRSGRKSYYQLTEHAKRQTRLAERIIYYRDLPDWDGSWTIVFLVVDDFDAQLKRELVQELGWIGFGVVTKGVLAHPGSSAELVGELIGHLGLDGKVICMRCENILDTDLGLPIDDQTLAALCLPVEDVTNEYEQFVDSYSILLNANGELVVQGSHAEMLSLRLLMVDEFRRVILKDPHLPKELLPDEWAGFTAYRLCGSIYRQLFARTNAEYLRLQAKAGSAGAQFANEGVPEAYQRRFSSAEPSSSLLR